MKTVEIAVIRDVADYHEALQRMRVIFDAEPGSKEYFELKILSMVIEDYETQKFKIPDADAVEIIEFILEQKGLKQNDLVGILGDKTTVSKILNRKRRLTVEMIRKFCEMYNVPSDVMIRDYEIA